MNGDDNALNDQKLQKNVCVNKLFWPKHSSYTFAISVYFQSKLRNTHSVF